MKKTIRVGEVFLRREHGEPEGVVIGKAVVLRLKVKSDLPHKTAEYQKVKFCFEGADPTFRKNYQVGDLFFKDYVGVTKDKAIKEYLAKKAADDREAAKAERVRQGAIPKAVYETVKHDDGLVAKLRDVYATKSKKK